VIESAPCNDAVEQPRRIIQVQLVLTRVATACRVILSPSQPVCQEYAQHAAFAQQGATPLEGGL
jgi:hypothetical protein